MIERGEALAHATAEMLGTPFRLHGNSPEFGVDCVGLVTCALDRIGRHSTRPRAYRLRNSSIERHLSLVAANGLAEANGPILAGDIIMVSPGPGQHHLLIAEGPACFIHAHAGLRKVVRTPGPLAWPIEKHWRLGAQN